MNTSAGQVGQQLRDAGLLLQAGDLARAKAMLDRILVAQPGLADAHWLLGGVLMRSGDFLSAERAVRTAIKLTPGNPSAHALLGEILACRNRMLDAESALRQALKLSPTHLQAISLLLRVLQAQKREEELLRYTDELLGKGLASPEILLARAQALLSLKKMPAAAETFRRVMGLTPGDVRARLGLAVAQMETGKAAEAEKIVRPLLDSKDGAEVRFTLARALLAQNRPEEAETELRKAIEFGAGFTPAQTNLAELVWMRTGDSHAATENLDRALRMQPDNVELRIFKAKLLEWAGRPQDALTELGAGLVPGNGNIALHLAAAQTAFRHDAKLALFHAEEARKLAPADPAVLSAWGNALLTNGRVAEAAETAVRLLRTNPQDGHAIALRASAWRMCGDARYATLYDYAKFVRPATIDTPPGWLTLLEYLRDLAAALHKRHIMQAHPIGQTLRTGTQVDLDLEHDVDPAIRAFAQAIDGPIRRYMQAIGSGNDVLRSRNVDDYRITGIWSVRLRANGHHVNHYHPEGWLSSACYIELPETLGAQDHEGWIKFGESGIPTQPPLEAEYFVKPEPGLLVLFPSWMWHGTVPFSGGERDRRLTIAFDVVPV